MHFFVTKLLSVVVMSNDLLVRLSPPKPTSGKLLCTQLINFSMRPQHAREVSFLESPRINFTLSETRVPELHDSSSAIGHSIGLSEFSFYRAMHVVLARYRELYSVVAVMFTRAAAPVTGPAMCDAVRVCGHWARP